MAGSDWREEAKREYVHQRAEREAERRVLLAEIAEKNARIVTLDGEIQALDQGAQVFGLLAGEDGAVSLVPPPPRQRQFKDVILDRLKTTYPMPWKASELQAEAEKELGRKFHWKTAGMTLYRLSQEGLVRRTGHKWFYMTPEERQTLQDIASQLSLSELLGDNEPEETV